MIQSLSQLIMELEQIDREYEADIQGREEAAAGLEAIGEQLYRLAGRIRHGKV